MKSQHSARKLNSIPVSHHAEDIRQYLRYDLVDYAIGTTHQNPQGIRLIISDVGLGGLSIRSKEPLLTGENIGITLTRGDGVQITVYGLVRFCEMEDATDYYRTGVQFAPRSHQERLDIAVYVNEAFLKICDAQQ